MPQDDNSFLFGNNRIATATSGVSEYGHTFGGPHDRSGTSREHCNGILIHLLHRLDLTDPAVPIVIPGIRWLPLYYCFDYRATELGYRLISEEELVTYFPTDDPNVSEEESWPADDYPLEFPKCAIKVEAYAFDSTRLDEAYEWAGIFGIGNLSAPDQAAAKKRVTELMKALELSVPQTDEDFEDALCRPFIQGKPVGSCLNPDCSNGTESGRLTTFALIPAEPVEGIHTFGRWGGGTELIFQICQKCHTIRVSNQCD